MGAQKFVAYRNEGIIAAVQEDNNKSTYGNYHFAY